MKVGLKCIHLHNQENYCLIVFHVNKTEFDSCAANLYAELMKYFTKKILAPAKLNLHLDIQEKRADGFHNLISIFQKIDMYDELSMTYEFSQENSCSISGDFDCSFEENTIFKAIHYFCSEYGVTGRFSVECKKHIPVKSGLGGGSSDAASVLLVLREAFTPELPLQELSRIAATVGSDVPFFIFSEAALVSGRGERIIPITPRKGLSGLVVVPDQACSTKDAYALLDAGREHSGQVLTGEAAIEQYLFKDPAEWSFINSFEIAYKTMYPVFSQIKQIFTEYGAAYSSLSGSGSAYFGLFLDEACKKAAFAQFKKNGFFVKPIIMLANL